MVDNKRLVVVADASREKQYSMKIKGEQKQKTKQKLNTVRTRKWKVGIQGYGEEKKEKMKGGRE